MDTYPKNRQGLCVGVLSGDRILFQGPPDRENGGYKQKILHLSGIQAPKVDPINADKDQRYGYASRQFMRKRLVGKKLSFVIEKKVNEIQIGYVLNDQGKDVTTELLRVGLARIRGDKVHAKNAEDYYDAEEEAKTAQVGVWNMQQDKKGYRNVNEIGMEQFVAKYGGQTLVGVAEEVNAFKSTVYFAKQGFLLPISYSDIQVVVLSQKNAKGQSKSNARNIRTLVESDFLQREVKVHISKTKNSQNIYGYLVNDKGIDIRRVLLENGYAKLSKEAINTLDTRQFMDLKQIGQKALEEGKGLWKQQKITKKQASSSKEYSAMVYQVHSGDSISVFNPIKNQIVRVFFPNTRAPSNGKPYAFEAKEALRKRCIGKKVRVIVEFTKNINVKKFEGDIGENKNFTFASVFEGDTNLSVWMLEQGLVSIQQIRTEEDISRFLPEMKDADQKSKKSRKGIHSGIDVKIPNFNDISGGKNKKIDPSKAKDMFEFLKDINYLSGTIQLVLNGSRFKVRFHQQNLMAIVVLDGVRCLPNQEQFIKISEEALTYSKHNALQRDVQIKIKRVDMKGIYHANLFFHNKRDLAVDLLQNGLAITVSRNKNNIYEEIEHQARNKRIGLWKFDFNLQSIKGGEVQKQFKPVNFTKKLILVEVVKANQFYLQNSGCKKPATPQNPPPATNIKVGEIYAAQFSVDKIYYRARIVREMKTGFEVFFIDYGNYDVVHRSKIGLLDEAQKKVKSPLFHCSLYGLQGFTKEAENILKDYINAEMKVEMKEQADDGEFKVIMYDIENKNKCVNLELLEFGEAENVTSNVEWAKAEQNAKRNREGKWNDE